MAKKSKFVEIKNQTDSSADLYFYGDIVSNWWGAWDDTDQYPEAIRDFLNGVSGKNLNIYVNSGGGSVFAGMAIYNMLKRHQGHKTVYVDGVAASIASVIALAGDKVVIPSNAFLMIHKPWMEALGNAKTLREKADFLDNIEIGIMNAYADRLKDGVDIETIRQMVQDETWLNGLEASQYFDIEVSQANEAVACVSDCFKDYKRTPQAFKEVPKVDPEPKVDETQNQINEMMMELDLI
ncbi:Clp protease ClpP [Brevibacillus choshinensis]|nr:Clp protease ClpP [Brevibacillus choshinensis]